MCSGCLINLTELKFGDHVFSMLIYHSMLGWIQSETDAYICLGDEKKFLYLSILYDLLMHMTIEPNGSCLMVMSSSIGVVVCHCEA